MKAKGGPQLSLGTFCAWKGNWRKRLGLPGLSASKGAVSKAQSDKTPSFVGFSGWFYEQSAFLWQKGRVRHSVCFLHLAQSFWREGRGLEAILLCLTEQIEETLQLFPEGAAL